MDMKKMFFSLIPWAVFSIVINRHGANAAGIAALIAAGLGLYFVIRGREAGSVKVIDAAGVVTFGALAAACFAGGTPVTSWVADYGRGSAALALAAVMLGSCLVVPFTEQYARESVPREYWHSAVFHSINRRISAAWGAVLLVMGAGHLLAGRLDPATAPSPGSRPVDLVLNWALPVGLVLLGIRYTERVVAGAGNEHTEATAPSVGQAAGRSVSTQ